MKVAVTVEKITHITRRVHYILYCIYILNNKFTDENIHLFITILDSDL